MIQLKSSDLSIQGSAYFICSVVIAPFSPVQPLRPFQAPFLLHFSAQQSHTSNSLPCDQIGENNVHIPASQRTQSARGTLVLLTSASAHTPPQQAGRQAVICVCLSDRYSPEQAHLQRVFICDVSSEGYLCLIRLQPLFLPHPSPNAGMVGGLKRVAILLPGNGEADV